MTPEDASNRCAQNTKCIYKLKCCTNTPEINFFLHKINKTSSYDTVNQAASILQITDYLPKASVHSFYSHVTNVPVDPRYIKLKGNCEIVVYIEN